jgi:hypothetical protein
MYHLNNEKNETTSMFEVLGFGRLFLLCASVINTNLLSKINTGYSGEREREDADFLLPLVVWHGQTTAIEAKKDVARAEL